jgi:ABC-type Fe3+-hydroxamate transport system substrate-binding protein
MVENVNSESDPGIPPQRVVSLAPFLTESLITLGLGDCLVGVTDLCPPSPLAAVRLGKPQSARLADILRLAPDLVLVNDEENPQALIEEIGRKGLRIRVVSPRTVRQAVLELRDIALMYASESVLQSVVWLERSVDWLEGARPEKRMRIFCPRRRKGAADFPESWETIGGDTYTGDLLFLCGAENVFAGRKSVRYPVVSPEEVAAAAPELVLLPEGPFPFSTEDAEGIRNRLPEIPAVKTGRIHTVDGRLLFWPGTILGEAIRLLPDLLQSRG